MKNKTVKIRPTLILEKEVADKLGNMAKAKV